MINIFDIIDVAKRVINSSQDSKNAHFRYTINSNENSFDDSHSTLCCCVCVTTKCECLAKFLYEWK